MRRSATKRRLTKRQRERIDRCANYLLKYQDYLAYDQYLAAGLPIGSDVIEGACRHLVNNRLGLTGARWRLRGADAVLRLRALRSGSAFDGYWKFHEAREYERTHRQHHADRQVPALRHPNHPQRPHLQSEEESTPKRERTDLSKTGPSGGERASVKDVAGEPKGYCARNHRMNINTNIAIHAKANMALNRRAHR